MMQGRKKRVAILATGNEIVNGDVTNSNSQAIAAQLSQHFITPGLHLSCDDQLERLEQSLHFLWDNHEAVITIGGLGPTSDDLTREAIARVLNLPLCFDEATWQCITDRFVQHNAILTENNRKQAYFPKQAKILNNPYGTASGCEIFHQQRLLFMLPGPPHECLPLFEQHVLKTLLAHEFSKPSLRKRWKLQNVSESYLASKIDDLIQNHPIAIAYCYQKPIIYLTLEADDPRLFNQFVEQIDQLVMDYRGLV